MMMNPECFFFFFYPDVDIKGVRVVGPTLVLVVNKSLLCSSTVV